MQRMKFALDTPPPPPRASDLPKFPGNNFNDAAFKGSFAKRQYLKADVAEPMDLQNVDVGRFRQTVTPPEFTQRTEKLYACLRNAHSADAVVKPKWMTLSDKILKFTAYWEEPTIEVGKFQIRKVFMNFYPEDDTCMVIEERVPNSGIQGGTLLKRHRIPMDLQNRRRKHEELNNSVGAIRRIPREDDFPEEFVSINDLNVGKEVSFYGKTFIIVDADAATRDFLLDMGINVPAGRAVPPDDYGTWRKHVDTTVGLKTKTWADIDMKMIFEQSVKGRTVMHYPEEIMKVKKFLADDGKVLCFKAVWDDRDNKHGDCRFFEVRFFVMDDTVEVLERNRPNCGRDPSRAFATRRRLPKDKETNQASYNLTFTSRINGAMADVDSSRFYGPQDFYLGSMVNVYGRNLCLVDCDAFTRDYYRQHFHVDLGEPLDVAAVFNLQSKTAATSMPPPHNGYGTEEDSLGNWKHLVLKAPPTDLKKWMQYDSVLLRFGMKFFKPNTSDDATRQFMLTFFLGDDTIQVTEQAGKNSGLPGGRFLKRQRFKKYSGEGPDCFYKWNDFFLESTVSLMSHRFIITSMDEFTRRFRYKKENMPSVVTAAGLKHMLNPLLEAMQMDATSLNGTLISDCLTFLEKSGCDSIIFQTMQQFNKDNSDSATLGDFLQSISGDPLATFGNCSAASDARQLQASILIALRKFAQSIANHGLIPSDAFILVSALPRSRFDETGGNATNALNSSVNVYQLTSALRENLECGLSDKEIEALVGVFFARGSKKQISMADFINVVTRIDDHLPAVSSQKV